MHSEQDASSRFPHLVLRPKRIAPQIISLSSQPIRFVMSLALGGRNIHPGRMSGATVDIQGGWHRLYAGTNGAAEAAAERIKAIVKVPEVGEYTGRVAGLQPLAPVGCFLARSLLHYFLRCTGTCREASRMSWLLATRLRFRVLRREGAFLPTVSISQEVSQGAPKKDREERRPRQCEAAHENEIKTRCA